MKRTEIERIERELKRAEKKERSVKGRDGGGGDASVGDYIERLFGMFRYDENEIFNSRDNVDILEVLEDMKQDLPEKKWEDVLKKAIKKTRVRERDRAYQELFELLGAAETAPGASAN